MPNKYLDEMDKNTYETISKFAYYYYRSTGERITSTELINEGYLAFRKAQEKFDPSKGIPFTIFLKIYLRGYMLKYIREQLVPLGYRNHYNHGKEVWRRFSFLSYNEFESEDSTEMMPMNDRLATAEEAIAESIVSDRQEYKQIRDLVQHLPFRYMTVAIGRYWYGMTLDEISGQLGLTTERIRQMLIQITEMVLLLMNGKAIPIKCFRKGIFTRYIKEEEIELISIKRSRRKVTVSSI